MFRQITPFAGPKDESSQWFRFKWDAEALILEGRFFFRTLGFEE